MNETKCTCPKRKCERHGNCIDAEHIMNPGVKKRDVKEKREMEIGNQFGIKYSEIRIPIRNIVSRTGSIFVLFCS